MQSESSIHDTLSFLHSFFAWGPRPTAGHFAYVSAGTKRFLEACNGVGIPFNPDFNTPRGTLGANTVSGPIVQ